MKIILATDGSESALAAVDFLARFPLPQDTEVTVVTVIDPTLFGCGDIDRLDEGERAAIAGTEESLRREALQLLDSEAARRKAETELWESTLPALP